MILQNNSILLLDQNRLTTNTVKYIIVYNKGTMDNYGITVNSSYNIKVK